VGVIIGMDPHKRSATIEVIDEAGRVLESGRFGTDTDGYAQLLAAGRKHTDRIWAVQGCTGSGKHLAHRLAHDGEAVVDVPAKLSAQVRVFATGNGRKTDPVDAHSVAIAALRAPNLVAVQPDPQLVVLGMLANRRDELGRARTQPVGVVPECPSGPPAPRGCWPTSARTVARSPPADVTTRNGRLFMTHAAAPVSNTCSYDGRGVVVAVWRVPCSPRGRSPAAFGSTAMAPPGTYRVMQ
jgi:xanthine/CO dehydrogenase XdhC/CoxF family maturation factor